MESIFGVYARKGLQISASISAYMAHPDRSMLMAGILSVFSGIFVVFRDRGNIFSTSFCAPLGEMKYAQVPKAFINLCSSTLSVMVVERDFVIHSGLGCSGLNRLTLVSP